MADDVGNVIIIGSGPAGLTAAIYAARAALTPLVIAGAQSGGQLMLTSDVENYPGFPEGILGPELMANFRAQAERFGAEVIDEDAVSVDFQNRPFTVSTDRASFRAKSAIIATGASAIWLGLASETRLRGRGVSTCATCDGFFFRGKELVVVGGGDTAVEEATFLTRFATRVTVVHRRDQLRASKIMQERAFKDPKIGFVWNAVVDDVLGDDKVEGVRLRDVATGRATDFRTDGLFVAIGYRPNTEMLRGQIELNDKGYVVPLPGTETQTNIPGVFVAGDVEDFHYRQAVTAAGAGCKAALDAERYLASLED
ncbi:MAG TPA: thioredoxin-disulfide reductase [Chloroflexota bacterium]|nr:thioredoxin-disulfide reductase [Chloroflexota bacterium]